MENSLPSVSSLAVTRLKGLWKRASNNIKAHSNKYLKVDIRGLPQLAYSNHLLLEPSKSIRLIKVHDSSWHRSDGVNQRMCTLETVPFPPGDLTYIALSYTWGAPLNTTECEARYSNDFRQWIFGEPGSDESLESMNIGRNLFEGLLRIMDRVQGSFYIWIDQICINQTEAGIPEKNQQISLMVAIYRYTSGVIVWLGEGISNLDGVAKIHSELGPKIPNFLSINKAAPREGGRWEVELICQQLGISRSKFQGFDWAAYGRFYAQIRWFWRAWVLQEIAVAGRSLILCGAHELLWTDMVMVSSLLLVTRLQDDLLEFQGNLKLLIRSYAHQQLLKLNSRRQMYALGLDIFLKQAQLEIELEGEEMKIYFQLLLLLLDIRDSGASDSRDKVFAVLGYIESSLPANTKLRIQPNYDITCRTRDVYAEAAKVLLETLPNFWILSFVGDPSLQDKDLNLPSWVPDWTNTDVNSIQRLPHGLSIYRAACSSQLCAPSSTELSISGSILTLQGVCFDRIEVKVPFKEDWSVTQVGEAQSLKNLAEMLKTWVENIALTKYTETKVNVLWNSIMAGRPQDASSGPLSTEHFEQYMAWLLTTIYAHTSIRDSFTAVYDIMDALPTVKNAFIEMFAQAAESRNNLQKEREYIEMMNSREAKAMTFSLARGMQTPNHTLFRTRDGRFGQSSLSMLPEDQIWLISGAQMPLVLRPEPANDTFKLIGAAYVHGCMTGELVGEWARKYQPVRIV